MKKAAKRTSKLAAKRKAPKGRRRVRAQRPKEPGVEPILLLDIPQEFSKKRLPRTLSGWIRSAVRDANRLKKRRGFQLDMDIFNDFVDPLDLNPRSKSNQKICCVCLGGAAIVGRGLVAPGDGVNGVFTKRIAYALDNVRIGDIQDALNDFFGYEKARTLGGAAAEVIQEVSSLIRENAGPKGRAPWRIYLKAAKALEQVGL